MIYLTQGVTQSVWMSLRETAGCTASFKFIATNDISGDVKEFYPTDLQPQNTWSRFNLIIATPEDLINAIDLRPGMWSLSVINNNQVIETTKIIVEEAKDFKRIARPEKKIKVLKR